MNYIAVKMPLLAPLPIPMVLHLFKWQRKHLKKHVKALAPEELDHAAWLLLENKVREKRDAVSTLMNPVMQAEKSSREVGLSTTWMLQALTAHMPGKQPVPSQTLSLWRERNLLRYREWGRPDADSAAALLLARMVDERIRNWLPTTIGEDEPHWWCWRQDTPEMVPIPCPIPLPVDLPFAALLWTPWVGAAWDPHWLKIGTGRGAIRWAGAVSENRCVRWTISQQELQRWDPEAAAFTIDFPECAEDMSHTLAHLALFRLAGTRLNFSTGS
jgi:hypothetical protein